MCNCSELVGYYTNNNWSGNFKRSDELVPKNYQYTNAHLVTQTDKETRVVNERRGMECRDRETEREDVRTEPKPACDGNLMRLNRVPTGQLTSASASMTKPPGPFMPRPDANKEN